MFTVPRAVYQGLRPWTPSCRRLAPAGGFSPAGCGEVSTKISFGSKHAGDKLCLTSGSDMDESRLNRSVFLVLKTGLGGCQFGASDSRERACVANKRHVAFVAFCWRCTQ